MGRGAYTQKAGRSPGSTMGMALVLQGQLYSTGGHLTGYLCAVLGLVPMVCPLGRSLVVLIFFSGQYSKQMQFCILPGAEDLNIIINPYLFASVVVCNQEHWMICLRTFQVGGSTMRRLAFLSER